MNFKPEHCVIVKGIGAAMIKEIIDDYDYNGHNNKSYFLFFFNGKRGGGYQDSDFEKMIPKVEFWKEWRRFKQYNF